MSKAYIKIPRLPSAPEPTRGREVYLYEPHHVSSYFPRRDQRDYPRTKKNEWTDDDENELRNLYRQGWTYLQIAQAMDRTESAVRYKIQKMTFAGQLEGRYKK